MPDDHVDARPAPGQAAFGVPSGVPGLDEVLGGGFPFSRIILVTGEPGTGKTTLGLQFIAEGAREREQGLYVTLSETAAELRASAASHGMSLDGVEVVEMLAAGETAPEISLFQAGEIEVAESANRILGHIERAKARRVVLDSVSALRLLFSDDLQFRSYLCSLKLQLERHGSTALLIETGAGDPYLQTFAYGVLHLEQLRREYGRTRRRLAVVKLRGTSYPTGYHDFAIRTGGVMVYPRVTPELDSTTVATRDLISSGLPEVDSLLGGGLRSGSSALFLGASGTGKSVMATQFAVAAALRGAPALVFLIDELVENYIERSRGLGIDADGALAAGRLRLTRINAAAISPGEFARMALTAVDRDGVRLIVIDSLGGYMQALSEERALILNLHELLASLAEKRVLTLLLLTEAGVLGREMRTPLQISYFSDAIIAFRYFEMHGEIHKCIAVLKKRYGPFESTIRELKMEPGKVSVGPPLRDFRGVLTGVPAVSARTDATE